MLFQQTFEALYFRSLLRGKESKALELLVSHLPIASTRGVHSFLDATFFQKFCFDPFKTFIE